jgi:Type IV secretory pathway, VirB10 components
MNRLDGDAVGPVKVLVSNPLYSHDHQHVIIPEGTVVLGEAKKIGAAGFGQQRRMAVVFHRLIMPEVIPSISINSKDSIRSERKD